MFELFTVVLAAIMVSYIIIGALAFVLFTNKEFLIWYTKKIYKISEKIEDELFD